MNQTPKAKMMHTFLKRITLATVVGLGSITALRCHLTVTSQLPCWLTARLLMSGLV